jgi:hypothetical protein
MFFRFLRPLPTSDSPRRRLYLLALTEPDGSRRISPSVRNLQEIICPSRISSISFISPTLSIYGSESRRLPFSIACADVSSCVQRSRPFSNQVNQPIYQPTIIYKHSSSAISAACVGRHSKTLSCTPGVNSIFKLTQKSSNFSRKWTSYISVPKRVRPCTQGHLFIAEC